MAVDARVVPKCIHVRSLGTRTSIPPSVVEGALVWFASTTPGIGPGDMSGWFARVSTQFRERLGSVGVATALAALIVFGVLAVLIVTVSSSQKAFASAATAVSVAAATEDAIVATAALQHERGLAASLSDADLYMYHQGYDAAIGETDRAMQSLRAAWAEHRAEIPDTATPSIGDVLSADVSLADFREAALSTSGESTYPLYSEVVATSVAATSELIKQSEDITTLGDRSLLVALLSLSERLNTQRFLIQDALVTGDPVSEELLLQLEVESDSLSQSFFEARSLAEGDDLAIIEEIRTGEASRSVSRMVEVITESGMALESINPQRWFDANTMRIGQVDSLIPLVHQRVSAVAGEELGRAERALWTRSILLSALFLLTVLVASNAVFATRERQEVLAEYGQLSDGLRQWFAPTNFPDSDSVDISARYIPASVRTQSGGDWYDVYEVGGLVGSGHRRRCRAWCRRHGSDGAVEKRLARSVNGPDAGSGGPDRPPRQDDVRLGDRGHHDLWPSRCLHRRVRLFPSRTRPVAGS